jgi:hypothetical protein
VDRRRSLSDRRASETASIISDFKQELRCALETNAPIGLFTKSTSGLRRVQCSCNFDGLFVAAAEYLLRQVEGLLSGVRAP